MKKLPILFIAAAILFFAACKKNDAVSTTDATQTTAALETDAASPQVLLLIQSLKGLASQDLKKVAFQLLKPAEKQAIWADNIKTVSANFTPEQKAVAAELSVFLSSSFFTGKPSIQSAIVRDQWLDKAQKVFTDDQIRALAFQLYSNTDHLVINNSGLKTDVAVGGGGGSSCNCNSGSVFSCGSDGVCSEMYFTPCKTSTAGCGFAFAYECNNICAYPLN